MLRDVPSGGDSYRFGLDQDDLTCDPASVWTTVVSRVQTEAYMGSSGGSDTDRHANFRLRAYTTNFRKITHHLDAER